MLQNKRVEVPQNPESTPKKIGNLLNWNNTEHQRLEEELMSTRLREMDALTELKELRLKVSVVLCSTTSFDGKYLWVFFIVPGYGARNTSAGQW
jgi:hypothetical protein